MKPMVILMAMLFLVVSVLVAIGVTISMWLTDRMDFLP